MVGHLVRLIRMLRSYKKSNKTSWMVILKRESFLRSCQMWFPLWKKVRQKFLLSRLMVQIIHTFVFRNLLIVLNRYLNLIWLQNLLNMIRGVHTLLRKIGLKPAAGWVRSLLIGLRLDTTGTKPSSHAVHWARLIAD